LHSQTSLLETSQNDIGFVPQASSSDGTSEVHRMVVAWQVIEQYGQLPVHS
jgi:hypothetical protein